MRLLVLDQIQVTAVRSDPLRPKEEIDVEDALGADLLATHPRVFRQLQDPAEAGAAPKPKAARKPANKAAKTPKNKSR